MNYKKCQMESLRKKLNTLIEESKGVITEDVIKISQQLDRLIVQEIKKTDKEDKKNKKSSAI